MEKYLLSLINHLTFSSQEVDTELKSVCELFISDVTSSFVSPLISLLDKMDTILKMAEAEGKDASALLKQQPFARAGKNKESILFVFWPHEQDDHEFVVLMSFQGF